MSESEDELRVRMLLTETRIVQLQREVHRLNSDSEPSPKRKKAPPGRRARAFAVSRGFCFYCEDEIDADTFTLDHVWPQSRGGTNEQENLVASCFPCNKSKGNGIPTEATIARADALYAPREPKPKKGWNGPITPKQKKASPQERAASKNPGLAYLFSQSSIRGSSVRTSRHGRNRHFGVGSS